LNVDKDGVTYKNYRAGKAVFCNGTHSSDWFGWLPIKPLKGEAILIKDGPPQGVIINRGVYVVPTLSGKWRVGATYNYGDLSPGVTEPSKRELTDRLQELVKFPFTVGGQEWGFRPTTPDRRPILGRHPASASVWTLNGLGTKGVSLAPYFADHLIDAMENGQALNKEVDIERYKLLYWTSPR
ncbi:MAG TPA: FAD-dependent oxidoreductase, partial [Chryseolinea sp.]|nr:FAD-dependent oxidoreductase [Chryseolinea sp.]